MLSFLQAPAAEDTPAILMASAYVTHPGSPAGGRMRGSSDGGFFTDSERDEDSSDGWTEIGDRDRAEALQALGGSI